MEPTLLLEKVSSYIRSPTPIMAPDGIWKRKGFDLGTGPPAYKTLLSTPLPSPLRAYQGLKLGIKTYLATWQLQAAYVFV